MNQVSTKKALSIYVTAGYPKKESLPEILLGLQKNGVDMVEIGMPYSDPLADGPTIQDSSSVALANGMRVDLLFEQVSSVRDQISMQLVYMGYFNSILMYGLEKFLKRCNNLNINTLIIPDLPFEIYLERYRDLFEENNIGLAFLITPRTSEERVMAMGQAAKDFLYLVAQSAVTGKKGSFSQAQKDYFKRIRTLLPKQRLLVGFGIHNAETLTAAQENADGAIIGSAFIRALNTKANSLEEDIASFIQQLSE